MVEVLEILHLLCPMPTQKVFNIHYVKQIFFKLFFVLGEDSLLFTIVEIDSKTSRLEIVNEISVDTTYKVYLLKLK